MTVSDTPRPCAPQRRRLLAAAGAAGMLATCGPSLAQVLPDRPIRLVVGFAPGGAADVIARSIGQALGRELGRQVVVDNRPGADGILSANAVRAASPDGTTLLLGTNTAMVAAPTLRPVPPYDPFKDFTPLSTAGQFTMFLVTAPQVPAATAQEFLAWAQANAASLTTASSNSASELALLQLLATRGVKATNARYKGDAQALVDVMSGRVQAIFTTGTSAPALVRDGKVRALLTLQPERSPLLPEVPTAAELGIRDLSIVPWAGFFGPPGMPPAVTSQLSDALQKTLLDPTVKSQLVQQGFEAYGMPQERFAAFFRARYDGWVETIRKHNVTFD